MFICSSSVTERCVEFKIYLLLYCTNIYLCCRFLEFSNPISFDGPFSAGTPWKLDILLGVSSLVTSNTDDFSLLAAPDRLIYSFKSTPNQTKGVHGPCLSCFTHRSTSPECFSSSKLPIKAPKYILNVCFII